MENATPLKMVLFRDISFLLAKFLLGSLLFAIKIVKKHETRKITRFGTFQALFRLVLRDFTLTQKSAENRHFYDFSVALHT